MKGKILHVQIDIRGAIRRGWWKEGGDMSLVGSVRFPDGRHATSDEILDMLLDHIAAGHHVLPIGEPCEGFSYETGCPGHEGEIDD